MVVPRTIVKEPEGKHYAIKRPLSATQTMLNILESPRGATSPEHGPEIRFNLRTTLALTE
ncbi:hypothetical protein NO2_1140 [Candidatus Termititenax persephonae]|uniref:Uncharacterized protein n=1 Tax=Candidatus Termititenax persephonae TaxID=2218525 RepID=A0A388THI9_9BACT|nr:hypothetical protein NO2_1140 [Candidatus Termititenax persephonae]